MPCRPAARTDLESTNCMRELRASVRAGKTIVTVRETEVGKGAMSDEEVDAALGDDVELLAALDLPNAIEWYRASHFQKTSLLQVTRRHHSKASPRASSERFQGQHL